jgi:acyl transferase domain-containing protein
MDSVQDALVHVARLTEGVSFEWSVKCFICNENLKTKDKRGKLKKVYKVQKKDLHGTVSLQHKFMSLCQDRGDKCYVDLSRRILTAGNLCDVGASYHKSCFDSLLSRHKLPQIQLSEHQVQSPTRSADKFTVDDLSHELVAHCSSAVDVSSSQHSSAVQVVTAQQWTVENCGQAASHHEYLLNVAHVKGMRHGETLGGGDCFFDAVRQGLLDLCLSRTVTELRLAACLELQLNAQEYRSLYMVDDGGQHVQAATYDEFVRRTRDGGEWATQMTVAAMAKALNVVIQVVSTDTNSAGGITAWMHTFSDGVTSHDGKVIVVGYNKQTAHYTAFTSARSVQNPRQVQSIVEECDVDELLESCMDFERDDESPDCPMEL